MLLDVLPFTERVVRRVAMVVKVPMATNCGFAPNTSERCFFASFGSTSAESKCSKNIETLLLNIIRATRAG